EKLRGEGVAEPANQLVFGREFDGLIDEIRISRNARYDKDFTPEKRFEPDGETVALYHCDEGASESLRDSDGIHHGKIVGAKWVKTDGTELSPLPTVESSGDGTSLFNGKDLSGWTEKGGGKWTITDGSLVGEGSGGGGWLMSNAEYSDFELELEYKLAKSG